MALYKCEGCGKDYAIRERWKHKACIGHGDLGLDKASVGVSDADAKRKPRRPRSEVVLGTDTGGGKPSGRWDRKAYNAYMKGYMVEYRKRKKAV